MQTSTPIRSPSALGSDATVHAVRHLARLLAEEDLESMDAERLHALRDRAKRSIERTEALMSADPELRRAGWTEGESHLSAEGRDVDRVALSILSSGYVARLTQVILDWRRGRSEAESSPGAPDQS